MGLTNKQKYNKKIGQKINESNSKEDIKKKTRIPMNILDEVYDRGIGAWKTNPKSVRLKKDFSKNSNLKKFPRSARLTKEQWAFARVYSFVMEGRTTKTADKDLYEKVKHYKWFKK